MKTYENREDWLTAALLHITSHFSKSGYTVPPVRLSCGWPSRGGTATGKRCIGEAWPAEAATDGVVQIFISPYLAAATEPQGVLATLVHEICHAVVGNKEKHNKVFGKCARAVGLEGKLTATNASEELVRAFEIWIQRLGGYPHAKLDLTKSPKPKQGTRMLKMECGVCGYTARTTKKWLDAAGPVHCPSHGCMSSEVPEEVEGE